MSYKRNDVIAATTLDDGLDTIIEDLRAKFEANIPWLEKSFGRAYLLPERLSDEVTYQYPQVYLDNGEYFNVMPNDSYQSYSWMIGKGSAASVEAGLQPFTYQTYFQKRLDIHFFLDLKKIDSTKNYVYTEELINDILNVLYTQRGLVVNEYIHETLIEVYEDYTIKEIDRDLLMYPFAGVRFVTTASYKIDCP